MSGFLRGNSSNSDAVLGAVDEMSPDEIDQLLSDLTPDRVLYIADLPASWLNGSQNVTVGTIPLTSEEAVVGTKIRIKGEVKVRFQGTSPVFGGDDTMVLSFNVAASAANPFEGVSIVISAGATCIFYIDAELELKTFIGGKYKVGVGANTPTYLASILRSSVGYDRWASEAGGSLVVSDPTTPETVGSTAGLVIQLQGSGDTTQSICNLWIDINCEVIPA